MLGRIAQLVQSTWFTPKGSGVRIPLRPPRQSLLYRVGFFYAPNSGNNNVSFLSKITIILFTC